VRDGGIWGLRRGEVWVIIYMHSSGFNQHGETGRFKVLSKGEAL